MLAIVWLLLAILAGWKWCGLIIGKPRTFLARASLAGRIPEQSGPAAAIFQAASSIWLGIMPLTWLTYLLAAAASRILPANIHPLAPVNMLLMALLLIYLALPPAIARLKSLKTYDPRSLRPGISQGARWPAFVRSLGSRESSFFIFSLLVFFLLSTWLMIFVFNRSGTILRAGYSVFSDFAPHTALVSSFARGANWPTQYPHFAGDGISYHFLFYFLCGNLDFLGLPADLAINLPSILGMFSFCTLLGVLAIYLTGRRTAFLLAPMMLFLRSSMAFFTFLADLVRQYGAAPRAWALIFSRMSTQSVFIGNTPRDDWGLWSINVYANQRHFLPGFSLALLVLFLLLPFLTGNIISESGSESGKENRFRYGLARKSGWLPDRPGDIRRLAGACGICFLLPYWHGSVLVGLLLILAVIAIFSRARLSFIAVALGSVIGALIQTSFFSAQAARAVWPQLLFGFIAEDKSLAGILLYLLEMAGLAIVLLAVSFFKTGLARKVMISAFIAPLIFAFTVSMTPDVTVNHKYIIMTIALGNIFVADLLLSLWHLPDRISGEKLARSGARTAAVFVAFLLMVTGIQEIVVLRNINRNYVSVDLESPLVQWITANTSYDAVFVTAPFHYHDFFLAGRYAWLGHSYYAWSAGHDTKTRLQEQQWLLRGGENNLEEISSYIAENSLDYLLIDDELRRHSEFELDEIFFRNHFQLAATLQGPGNIVIIDLNQRLN